jgi:hypothetical protein
MRFLVPFVFGFGEPKLLDAGAREVEPARDAEVRDDAVFDAEFLDFADLDDALFGAILDTAGRRRAVLDAFVRRTAADVLLPLRRDFAATACAWNRHALYTGITHKASPKN